MCLSDSRQLRYYWSVEVAGQKDISGCLLLSEKEIKKKNLKKNITKLLQGT